MAQAPGDVYVAYGDPVQWVIGRNAHRRHLTELRRASCVSAALDWATQGKRLVMHIERDSGQAGQESFFTQDERATLVDVSERTQQRSDNYHHNDPKHQAELRVYQEIEATQISGQALYEVKAARHSPEVDFVVWVEDIACFTLQENALVADYRANANSHTAHLMDFTAGRIATASDIPTNRKLDTPC